MRILQQVTLADTGGGVPAEAVAKRIEATLIAFPETEAFLIASHNPEEQKPRVVTWRRCHVDLLKAFTPATIEHQQQCAA